jgi:hypothetical protein
LTGGIAIPNIQAVTKNKAIYIGLSLAFSAALLWVLLSRIETRELIQTFARIHYPALGVYLAVSLISAWLRAWRYRWLLQPQLIPWKHIFPVTFIRNCFDDLLPARIGSLSYIYVLNKRLNFSFEAAASTFVVAFVLDFLTLSPFVIAAVAVTGFISETISSTSLFIFAGVFFALIFLLLWKLIPLARILLKAYQALLATLSAQSKRWAFLSVEKFRFTIDSLEQIRLRKIYLPLFFLSLFIRLAKYVSIFFLLFALLRSHGFSLPNLSFSKTILGITGAELTSALPIKGIAGFGTWESAWAVAFRLMNFDERLAIISGIGVHWISNLWEYSLGLVSILILAFPLLRKK